MDSEWHSCDVSCKTCFGPQALDCSACHEGCSFLYLLLDRVCKASCPEGSFRDLDQGRRVPCHSTCAPAGRLRDLLRPLPQAHTPAALPVSFIAILGLALAAYALVQEEAVLARPAAAATVWTATAAPRRDDCDGEKRPLRLTHLLEEDQGGLLACSAIIRGDTEGLEETNLSRLLASRKKSRVLSEAFFLNATRDCKAYLRERKFLTSTPSREETEFPVAYSMVVHEQIEMFERLLRAIYVPHNIYCVHVDRKSPDAFKLAVQTIVSCLPNVFVASKLESVVYASWSRVQADLNCMEDLMKSPVRWRYLLNTCGTDFPIKTNGEIVRALQLLDGRNSMESEVPSAQKKDRWLYRHDVTRGAVVRTSSKKGPPPIGTPMFSGNAYFVVTREFVRNLFESEEVRSLIEWEKDTFSPDEHLWATLQRMPSVPGSNPPNSKFQQSDMQAIARLVKWSYLEGDVRKGAPYPPCTGTHRRAICVYGTGDLRWMLSQHHLLANKFDPQVDDLTIRCLEAYLRYKVVYGKPLTEMVGETHCAAFHVWVMKDIRRGTGVTLPTLYTNAT
ncbi:beta-1,3-galactosyl-O-glycosyl-glycoprotein beta-1,6-N-acetylglucosaminyltransferase 3-like [Conger conger]|uniref:beta-1,3-galactosyl-O-glycosyl-glycoprotein beta-1,6-N-acetylglucosaminyltransferase 3-like n=1 Tax=Conger conger TaxID=82655 RepID=UPI002A5A7D7D|nr:beta-1,3-galactosyl-O-glycosyl-glycoprotein beta-1,6-N-acetylglucosaminyltransferase 3-like [Conger conger]